MKIPDDISLSLLGAETTFADVDYIIEASVFFCSPQNDYLVWYRIELIWKLKFEKQYIINQSLNGQWAEAKCLQSVHRFCENPEH